MDEFVRLMDHTSIALENIEDGLPLFRDLLGGKLVGGEVEGVFRWVQLIYPGGGKIELMDPTGPGFLRRFLDTHGPGVHHVTFKVHDLRAAVEAAKQAGYEVVGENYDHDEWKEAFLHPRTAHGILIQLAQAAHDEGEPGSPYQEGQAEKLLAKG